MNINLTLIGQAISFALFVFFCMRFVWPPVIRALRERQKTISDGLVAAERAKSDLAKAQEESGQEIMQGRKQAEEIIATANKQAEHIIETAKLDAQNEAQRIVQAGQQEAEQNAKRMRGDLVHSLGSLVYEGVSKIIKKEVDMKQHKSIIDSLGKELG